MKHSDDYALLFLSSQMFLLNKSSVNSMWSHSEVFFHVRHCYTHTMEGVFFLLCFWAICCGAAAPLLAFLPVSFQLTCIVSSGHPSPCCQNSRVIYFTLPLSFLCYSFGYIPTSCKLSQTKLFVLARNYLQFILRHEIRLLRS